MCFQKSRNSFIIDKKLLKLIFQSNNCIIKKIIDSILLFREVCLKKSYQGYNYIKIEMTSIKSNNQLNPQIYTRDQRKIKEKKLKH